MSDEELNAFKSLRDALLDGRFFGIGFPEPKRPGDYPLQIPHDAWAPEPEALRLGFPDVWGRLPYGTSSFCEVRIAPTAEHLTRTQGRPTLAPILTKAIYQMADDGEIDTSKKQTAHFPQVRQRAKQMFPSHKDEIDRAKDRTISKYFSSIFNNLSSGRE
jgi:hypothetical protein